MEEGSTCTFYSHGKLLLTAEYLVLEGAKALAVPTKKGQWLHVKRTDPSPPFISWKGFGNDQQCWIQAEFNRELKILAHGGNEQVTLLRNLLAAARKQDPTFLTGQHGFEITTRLEFPRNWGLGSSSTLVNNLADWAGVDAFELQFSTFGGSGYDIACARHKTPIVYQLTDGKPVTEPIEFSPSFSGQLFFVYLGEKQNSRQEIKRYHALRKKNTSCIADINALTSEMITCRTIGQFATIVREHERIISGLLARKTIREERFGDYTGPVKSLGAWGGDFILSAGEEGERDYFRNKGYSTILSFEEMVLDQMSNVSNTGQ